ncbi:hypothetical protein FRC07_000701, partial [Ceratobasidium sp. 392]
MLAYSDRRKVTKAVVVGGGLLGLEAAKALYDSLAVPDVSIINHQAFPLSRQLDGGAGAMVLRKIGRMGVRVYTKVNVTAITTEKLPQNKVRWDGRIELLTRFDLNDGTHIAADMAVFGTSSPHFFVSFTGSKGGVTEGFFIIREMADTLAFNLTQTLEGEHKLKRMNDPDLSAKLKLMGVDVASFGDFFADQRMCDRRKAEEAEKEHAASSKPALWEVNTTETTQLTTESRVLWDKKRSRGKKPHQHRNPRYKPIKCLTYKDPFASVYKRYIFSADGKYLMGGMMIWDMND